MSRLRTHLPYFVRYVLIGGFVFCLDIGTFAAFLHERWPVAFFNQPDAHRITATVLSLAIAFSTHFTLNKYANFRNFDRSTRQQFGTYLIVALFCTLVSVGIIEGGVCLLGMSAIAAKCVAVAVNIPIGFVGHRTLTFGSGLSSLKKLRRAA